MSIIKKIFHSLRRKIAWFWLKAHPVTQIAVTGSQGKTNTTRLIAHTLSSVLNSKVVSTDLNLDTLYNLPITALHVTSKTEFVVFEVGVDHKGEMDKHLNIISPRIAVVTGISPVHSDEEHLGSLKNIVEEKSKLVVSLSKDDLAILNYDDESVKKMAKKTQAKVIWFGSNKQRCKIFRRKEEEVEISLKGTKFSFYDGRRKIEIETSLIGEHHIYNVMAAYAVLKGVNYLHHKTFKLSSQIISRFVDSLRNIKPLKGRMSIEKGPRGTVILDDLLRANPASTRYGLITFSKIKYSEGKKIAVLGEMGELGKLGVRKHKEIGRLVSKLKVDYLISVGPLQRYVYEEAIKNGLSSSSAFWVSNPVEAGEVLKKIVRKGDFIYFKASLLRHMERAILVLEGVKVKCTVPFCHFYHSCRECKYLKVGYPSDENSSL